MITVTEPQVWTIIGVLAASLFGTLTLITNMFTRVIRAEVGGVTSEVGTLRTEISSVRTEIGIRLDGIDRRLDNLDRDVQYLMRREIERDN